jgi:hypothetical protein
LIIKKHLHMKSISKIFLICITALLVPGCNEVLDEHPYTAFTTQYFESEEGLNSAVVAAYAGMRYNYGPVGALDITAFGTDEWSNGDQALNQDLNVYNVTTTDGSILTPWNRNYWHINLCNAVVDIAPGVEMAEGEKNTLVAEARYLRANYYFLLVSQFGAVPLDLGSGELKFNTEPTTEFYRLPVEELLVKNYQAMIDDLTFASENLPDQRPVAAFRLSKSAALHLLAKVYLHRGYSAAADGNDFQNAYTTARKLIDNQATYGVGLLADYGDVNKEGNDYNKEILYSVERLPLNNAANEIGSPGTDFANKANQANNMYNCNYQQAVPATYYNADLRGKSLFTSRVLQYGRPLRRFAPTKWLFNTAFSDKLNDSRFDNSFRMVWLADTWEEEGTAAYDTYVNHLAGMGLELGDTAIYLTKTDAIAESLKALTGDKKKHYLIVGPKDFYTASNATFQVYPSIKKFDAIQRANFNDASGRPFAVSKLSETYLLAAEAAMQIGQTDAAATLINVLKLRAAYRPGLSAEEITSRYDKIKVDASAINLDFILDERSRELCGEGLRWIDLAVRGKLIERASAHNPQSVNIKVFHTLRPIPQSQLDAISDPDKAKYQNSGY